MGLFLGSCAAAFFGYLLMRVSVLYAQAQQEAAYWGR